MFRNSLLTRLVERLPAKLLNDVMQEIDLLSQDYTFEKACTDIITLDAVPEMVKVFIASMAVRKVHLEITRAIFVCSLTESENRTQQ